MSIKESVNKLFYDEEKKIPKYENYLTFMIDNPEYFHSFLVPQVDRDIEANSLSLEEYSLSKIIKEKEITEEQFKNNETPFQNPFNLQNPKCVELIKNSYNEKLLTYQKRINSFNYQNEKELFINDFITIETEIYNVGGHCKLHNHKEYSINDICNFVNENADDLYKCYLYLLNNN